MPRTKSKPKPVPPPAPSRAQAVKLALVRRGWTQRDLSVALDLSPQRLSDVLSGRRAASEAWWAKLALALELPWTELRLDPRVCADVTRPAAELELVLHYPPGGAPGVLVPWNDADHDLAEQLGIPPQIGPGDLGSLVLAGQRHKVAISLRLDMPPLA